MEFKLTNARESAYLAPFIPGADKALLSHFWESLAQQETYYLTEWRRHRLTPLLYGQIVRLEWQNMFSEELLAALKADYLGSLAIAIRQEEETRQVLRLLHQAGIEVALLKGADLRHRVYGDPALRTMSDLDLIVSQKQVKKVQEILVELGYGVEYLIGGYYRLLREHYSCYIKFSPPEGKILPLDVHWELFSVAAVNRVTYKDLNDAATIIDYHGVPVKLLSPEHLLLHVALHALDHSFDQTEYDSDLGQKILDLVGIMAHLDID